MWQTSQLFYVALGHEKTTAALKTLETDDLNNVLTSLSISRFWGKGGREKRKISSPLAP